MADLKQKKHLFFDWDDTLWDFQKNSAIVLEELFSEFELAGKLNTGFKDFLQTYKRLNYEFWSRYYKQQITKEYIRNHRFNETFKQFGYDNFEENLRITEQYLGRAPKGIHLKEHCVEVLDYLKPNYTLHVITNGFREVQDIKIDGCGLRSYFKNIIISEEHGYVKPHEKIFRLAEQFAGTQREECVMIGDSLESDIEGAMNAGWETIYFNEDQNTSHLGRTIKKLEELKNMF